MNWIPLQTVCNKNRSKIMDQAHVYDKLMCSMVKLEVCIKIRDGRAEARKRVSGVKLEHPFHITSNQKFRLTEFLSVSTQK